MGKEAVIYKNKYFWMQGASAEFWYTIYFRVLSKRKDVYDWEKEFAKEKKNYIDKNWLLGTLVFDHDLTDQNRLDQFIKMIKAVNNYIYELAKHDDNAKSIAIAELDWRMRLDIIIPEMEMFYKFFAYPEEVPDGYFYKYTEGVWIQLE